MLRPTKGEGERPSTANKDKRPHVLARTFTCSTVVFLAVSPILLATQATSAYAAFGSAHQQPQTQPQKGQAFLRPTQPGTTLGPSTYLSPRQAPSKDELAASLATLKATLTQHTSKLQVAKTNLQSAKATLSSAQSKLTTLSTSAQSKQAALEAASTALTTAKSALDAANADLATLDAAMKQQTNITAEAQAALTAAQAKSIAAAANLQTAEDTYDAAQSNLTSATQTLQAAQSNLTTAQTNLTSAYNAYQQAQQTTQTKQTAVQTAQAAYDASQVPNPNYVAPAYTVQPTTYQIPDNNFNTGTPWIGDGSGQSGQPEIHPGHIHFSYIPTEVYQDILISPRTIANYTYTVSVWNQDQNSVGQGAIADQYGLGIILYDANDNVIHQDSLLSTEVHSWRDVTLQGTNPNPNTPVAKVRIVVAGYDKGFWAGTYGPAMMNVRMTLGWITGSTQAATTTGTMQVSINEGGEATFVAPAGGVFTSSNLRYEAIDDSSCGTDITPNNLGGNTIQLVADNSLWGDPCGGSYKRIVGTLTYSASEPQFIKDPALLLAIATAESELTAAQQAETAAYNTYNQAEDDLDSANAQESSASQSVSSASTTLSAATTELATSTQEADDAADELADAQSTYSSEVQQLATATGKLTTAKSEVVAAEVKLSTATTSTQSLEVEVNNLVSQAQAAETQVATAETSFSSVSTEITNVEADIEETTTQIAEVEAEIAAIPEPTPEPEEEEIVALPSLEDLTKVNFEEIVATDLTEAQAEKIKEAALETFETAEKGSEEYTAALEALFVAAQQNDITVDPALAEIPGVGAAAVALIDAVNFLGNAGADMSPQVREESEKVVVTAVVAGNAAIAAAAGAASSAAAAAATSSGPSGSSGSTSRKIN